jgi:DNA-binding transcriptional LysR family regulator
MTMTRLPDFDAWAIFAKVAETGSFSRAAMEFGLSKATVSKAVGRLEAKLRATLFHRTSRRLTLTDSGRSSLERARRVLAEGEELEQEAAAQSATPRGLVRLAAPMSFGITHVAPALPQFLKTYPEISIDLVLSDELIDLVSEGFDAALRISNLTDSSLLARKLCTVRGLIVGSKTYFDSHGRPKHPRDLAAHRCVIYSYARTPGTWHFAHARHGDFNVNVRGPLRANNAEAMVAIARQGLAIAQLPEFTVWSDIKERRLESVLTDWLPPPGGLHLVTPPGSMRPLRVQLLIDFLARRYARMPWA